MWRKIKPIAKSRYLNCIPYCINSELCKHKNPLMTFGWYDSGLWNSNPIWINLENNQTDLFDCVDCNRGLAKTTNNISNVKECDKPKVQCDSFDKILNQTSNQRKFLVADEATNWYKNKQIVCMPEIEESQLKKETERKFPILCASQYKRISVEFLRLLQTNSDKVFQQAENIILNQERKSAKMKTMPCIEAPKQRCVEFADNKVDDLASREKKSKKSSKKKNGTSKSSILKTKETDHNCLTRVESKEIWKSVSKTISNVANVESPKLKVVQPKHKATVTFIDQEHMDSEKNNILEMANSNFTLKVPTKKFIEPKETEKYFVDVVLNREASSWRSETNNLEVKSVRVTEPPKSILKRRVLSKQNIHSSQEKGTQTDLTKHKSRSLIRNLRIKRKPTPHSSCIFSDTNNEENLLDGKYRKIEPEVDKTVKAIEKKPIKNRLKGGFDNYTESSMGSFVGKKPILSLHEIHKPLSYERSASDCFIRDRHRTQNVQKSYKMYEKLRKNSKPQKCSSKAARTIYKVQKAQSSDMFYNSPERSCSPWRSETRRNTTRNEQESIVQTLNNKFKTSNNHGPSHVVCSNNKDTVYNVCSSRSKRNSKNMQSERNENMLKKRLPTSRIESSASDLSDLNIRSEVENVHSRNYRHQPRQSGFQRYKKRSHQRALSGGERSMSSSLQSLTSNFISETELLQENCSNDIIIEESYSDNISDIKRISEKTQSSNVFPHIDSKDIYIAVPKWKIENVNKASKYLRSKKSLACKNKNKDHKKRNKCLKDQSTRLQSGSEPESSVQKNVKRFFWQRRKKRIPTTLSNKDISDDRKHSKYYVFHEKKKRQSPNDSEEEIGNRIEELTSKGYAYKTKNEPKRKVYELFKSSHRLPSIAQSKIHKKPSESFEDTEYEKKTKSKKFYRKKLKESDVQSLESIDDFENYSREYASSSKRSKYNSPSSSNRKSPEERISKNSYNRPHNSNYSNYERDLNVKPSNFKHNTQREDYVNESRYFIETASDSTQMDDRYYRNSPIERHADSSRAYKSRKDDYNGQYQETNIHLLKEEYSAKAPSRTTSEEFIRKEDLYSNESESASESVQSDPSQSSIQHIQENIRPGHSIHNVEQKSNPKQVKGKKAYSTSKRKEHRYPSPSFQLNTIPGQVVVKKIMREDLLKNKSRNKNKEPKEPKQNSEKSQSYRVMQNSKTKQKNLELNKLHPEYVLGHNDLFRSKTKRYKN